MFTCNWLDLESLGFIKYYVPLMAQVGECLNGYIVNYQPELACVEQIL